MELGTLNIILIIVLAGFAVVGAIRGFAGELAPLIAALVSGVALWFGQPYLRDGVLSLFPNLQANAVVFYTAIFAVVIAIILFFFVSKLTKHLGQWIIPQPFNAILGFLIGGGKAFLLISIIAGAITASKDHIQGIQAKTKESVIANAAAAFWSSRFNNDTQDDVVQLPSVSISKDQVKRLTNEAQRLLQTNEKTK